MKIAYEIRNGALAPSDLPGAGIVVYASPDDADKQEILRTLPIDRPALDSALDPDEISRVEVEPEGLFIIWKRPDNVSYRQQFRFEVSSMGVFLETEKVTIVFAESTIPFGDREFQKTRSLTEATLKLFLHTIHHYMGHLKAVKSISRELQSKLSTSMENQYLLQMFNLSESLVYYLNALEANGAVLSKLRVYKDRAGFSQDDMDLLDDLIIENQQACKQAAIYSSVLSGLMDARGTIINNNMNVLLKNLTLINVVFLPLNLIAGILGMSEFTAMTHGLDLRYSFAFFALGMVFLGWLTWIGLVRRVEKVQRNTAELP
jgi:magnesium transporter